jgi:hypothetical protein
MGTTIKLFEGSRGGATRGRQRERERGWRESEQERREGEDEVVTTITDGGTGKARGETGGTGQEGERPGDI